MNTSRQVRLRRTIGICVVLGLFTIDIYATGLFGGSERTLAVVRSLVLPGLPLLEWRLLPGLLLMGVAIGAIVTWLRWGVDWLPIVVMAVGVAIAGFAMPLHHDTVARAQLSIVLASHEFTVVLVLFALVARLRLMFDRFPGSGWVQRRLPPGLLYPAVDVARAAGLALLATGSRDCGALTSLASPALIARAAAVNRWARFRFQDDPLSGAHAPLRAALSLAGLLDPTGVRAFRDDARTSLAGVPHSEPTWIRPLDGMLAALALRALGEDECVARWRSMFEERFALRHGRRPAALHAPSMLSIGAAPAWEHAASTALGFRAGWLDETDWGHLRPRCLGKAASGAHEPEALRLIAAGMLWARLTQDTQAIEILGRRTISGDGVAMALNELADGGDKHDRRIDP